MKKNSPQSLPATPIIRRLTWEGKIPPPDTLLDYEWIVTNGYGGYASSTVPGISTRKYHGLLVAAVPAPYGRMVMLSTLKEEILLADGTEAELSGEYRGTLFGIGVDPQDGLLRQGHPDFPLTWMDAKVGKWIVTPRRGKAVEINALWYNALRLFQGWREERGRTGEARKLSQLLDSHCRIESALLHPKPLPSGGNYLPSRSCFALTPGSSSSSSSSGSSSLSPSSSSRRSRVFNLASSGFMEKAWAAAAKVLLVMAFPWGSTPACPLP